MSARFPVPSRLACLCVSALLAYARAGHPSFAAVGVGKPVLSSQAPVAEDTDVALRPAPSD